MKIEKVLIDSQKEQIGEYSYYTDMVEPGFHEFVTDISDKQVILVGDMNQGEIKSVYVDIYDTSGQKCTNNTLNRQEVIETFKVNFNHKLNELYSKNYELIDEGEEIQRAIEERADNLRQTRALRQWF